MTSSEWILAITAMIAAGALVLGIINYNEAREPIITWRIERDQTGESSVSHTSRIFNDSRRFAGYILSIKDPEEDDHPGNISVNYTGKLPTMVEPGNGIPINALQYPGRSPTRIRIVWKQRRATGRWIRPIKRTVTLFR